MNKSSISSAWCAGLLGLFACVAIALPGEPPGGVLPNNLFSELAQGEVVQSLIAADGSVLIQGDFTHVNGIARPGVAVLNPNGGLATEFVPEAVPITGQPPPIWGSVPVLGSWRTLADGTWINHFRGHTLAYHADGSLNPDYEFLNTGDAVASIALETETALYVLRTASTGRWLEAYSSSDFEPLPFDGEALWPAPFVDMVPAADGTLWVLGRDQPQSGWNDLIIPLNPEPWSLFRITVTGELDSEFVPRELSENRHYRLQSREQGGFALIHYHVPSWHMWPAPISDHQAMVIDLYDADGIFEISRSVDILRGRAFAVAEETDGSLLYNVGESTSGQLVRVLADGSHDPDFDVSLSGSSFQLLSDGRIQHSHIHRILADGSPDPDWTVPELTTDPEVELVGRFADGSILCRRMRTAVHLDGPELFVLGTNLLIDASFQATNLPPALSWHMAHDGLSVFMALRGIYEFPDGSETRILRLLRDGSIDPLSPRYIPSPWVFYIEPGGEVYSPPFMGDFHVMPLANDSLFVSYLLPHQIVLRTTLIRVMPDGNLDPTFTDRTDGPWPLSLLPLADGRFLVRNSLYFEDGSLETVFSLPQHGVPIAELEDGRLLIRRYNETLTAQQLAIFDMDSGLLDPDFGTEFHAGTRIDRVLPLSNGTWLVQGIVQTETGPRSLVRLYADGRLDPTFLAPEASRTLPLTDGLATVVRDGEPLAATFAHRERSTRLPSLIEIPEHNALLVAGDYTHIGEEPRSALALLSLEQVSNFSGWLETFPDQAASNSNALFAAYVAGTDPLVGMESPKFQLDQDDMSSWRLLLNPDAEDVGVDVEVSNDLLTWRLAAPDEATLTPVSGGLHLSLPISPDTIFFRVRFRHLD